MVGFLESDFAQFLVQLSVYLLPILAGWAIRIWRQNSAVIEGKIAAEIGEKYWDMVKSAAETLIHAAEQVSGIDTNEEKKAFVLDQLIGLASMWNMPFSDEQLDLIIEGIFREWVKDTGQWATVTSTASPSDTVVLSSPIAG